MVVLITICAPCILWLGIPEEQILDDCTMRDFLKSNIIEAEKYENDKLSIRRSHCDG